MTKSIIEIAREAGMSTLTDECDPRYKFVEAFAAAIKAVHTEQLLAGVEMPEPVAWVALIGQRAHTSFTRNLNN